MMGMDAEAANSLLLLQNLQGQDWGRTDPRCGYAAVM